MSEKRVALITGGSGGVGMAAAEQFLSNDYAVMLTDIAQARLEQAAQAMATDGRQVAAWVSDVTNVADCERAVAETVKQFGRLDVLANTAGVWVEGDPAETSEEEWDWCIDVNLKGTFFMCSRAIPELKKTRGAIINVASDAGLIGLRGAAVYCASKGGVVNMTRALALDLAEDLVRVNAICPSDIDTPMLSYQAETYGGGNHDAYLENLLSSYPQGDKARFLEASEVASLIVYLASDAARGITGAAMNINFGTTAGLW